MTDVIRTVAEHRRAAVDLVAPVPPGTVPLADALGLVLAVDVTSSTDLPRWDNSAMDGYAVRAADTTEAADRPVLLRVVADLPAGSAENPAVLGGMAARIMTGAPVPHGADAIVPVEDTDGGTAVVRVLRPAPVGAHIRRAGEDLLSGDPVVDAGVVLGPRHLAALASVGRDRVQVRCRARVAVISTGTELVPPGAALRQGQIPDSNSLLLASAVRAAGAEVTSVSSVGDDPAALRRILNGLAGTVDLVLTSGGVSMGAYEVVRQVLEGRPGMAFVRVAMQPGKPQGLGVLDGGTAILCLPGNPVSAYVSFEVFVRPVLDRLAGLDPAARPVLRATVDDVWTPPSGRTQYMPVVISGPPTDPRVRRAVAGGSGSHLVAGLARADGLAIVPAGTRAVRAGDHIDVLRSV
ncbi:MAG TPA: gephyrin-like molybdotransferase Glp [Actinotalea sp.]|nr:gephyrin-like molybdotransferase Glp [Actinotalea sp.]